VATAAAIVGAAWSPDGSSIAVSTLNHSFVPSLDSYVVRSDLRTAWAGDSDAKQEFIVPAGWWHGWGIVYTVIDDGAVPEGEGGFENADLYSLAGPDATPRFLGETEPNDSAGAPTATSNGILTFVSSTSPWARTPWDGKQVLVCVSPSNPCTPVPTPAGDVTGDPSLSTSGSILAYVAAPGSTSSSYQPKDVADWYNAHSLEVYDPTTGTATGIAAAQGATVPTWSGTGSGLLYASDNGLWLLPNATASPVEIASPLFTGFSDLNVTSYYGEVDWAQQFGWSKGAVTPQCYVVCDPQL
jgi:hypothetical protein